MWDRKWYRLLEEHEISWVEELDESTDCLSSSHHIGKQLRGWRWSTDVTEKIYLLEIALFVRSKSIGQVKKN